MKGRTEMKRKKMTRSKAEVIVRKVTEAFLEAVAEHGLEVAKVDFEDAMWLVLHRRFIIED